jgi:TPR repeat protein
VPSQAHSGGSRKSKAMELFLRGDKDWNRGRLRSALRLFRAAAKAGDAGALLNVGYFYQNGLGVRQNTATALDWYKRAYRRGDASAANNIGTIWRDRQQHQRALTWFRRATAMGNDSSNLEIAKCYLQFKNDPSRAIVFLKRVCRSSKVSEAEQDAAQRLLKQAEKLRR